MKRRIVERTAAILGCVMAAAIVTGNLQGIPGLGGMNPVIEPMTVYAENYSASSQVTGKAEKKQDSNVIAIVNLVL